MIIQGVEIVFSTENDGQYQMIGEFWDLLSRRFGRSKLRGLGYGWEKGWLKYLIGLESNETFPWEDLSMPWGPAKQRRATVPDEGWLRRAGKTADLPRLYEEIYRDGPPTYEIERFDDEGNCEIFYTRRELE